MSLVHTSQNSSTVPSFLFWSWNILFFTLSPSRLWNFPPQILQEECFQPTEWKARFNSVSWSHTAQSTFTDRFFLVFIGGHLVFHYWAQFLWTVSSQMLQKDCFQTAELKERFNTLRYIYTSKRSLTDRFFLVFIAGYLVVHYRLQGVQNVP